MSCHGFNFLFHSDVSEKRLEVIGRMLATCFPTKSRLPSSFWTFLVMDLIKWPEQKILPWNQFWGWFKIRIHFSAFARLSVVEHTSHPFLLCAGLLTLCSDLPLWYCRDQSGSTLSFIIKQDSLYTHSHSCSQRKVWAAERSHLEIWFNNGV